MKPRSKFEAYLKTAAALARFSGKSGPAMDKREINHLGRMYVDKSNISKANVCIYYGIEIPGWAELGLDPDKAYRLWRHPDELKKAAKSFENIPLVIKHKYSTAATPAKELWIGTVGAPVQMEGLYLTAPIVAWTDEAIALINSKKQEQLSASYDYTPVMTPGVTPEKEEFDGIMTRITGNHVAIVEEGRAGIDVKVSE